MELKENIEVVTTSEKYYDLFDGGYIKPEHFLKNKEDVKKVKEARETLIKFFDLIEDKELLLSM